jgi:bile acid:Na+ symporter, BASS family
MSQRVIVQLGKIASNYFIVFVLIACTLSYIHPGYFLIFANYISYGLGVIMLGMGMTLTGNDFKDVIRRPYGIGVGVFSHFLIMPFAGYLVAALLKLDRESAVGHILVGSCPAGTASNVVSYLAKADVPLSVSMTTCTTLLAPFLTPWLVYFYAGQWVEVNKIGMMLEILQIVILPVGIGLILHTVFKKPVEKIMPIFPAISVFVISLIVATVVALNIQRLHNPNWRVFLAVVIHNGLGLLLGYWSARLFRLDEKSCRTVSIEVGMQNSGLGVVLAKTFFTPATALPSAIFSIWHNISGPALASYWSRKPPKDNQTT